MKGGAIFRELAESRAGVATEPSDGEARVVTESHQRYHILKADSTEPTIDG